MQNSRIIRTHVQVIWTDFAKEKLHRIKTPPMSFSRVTFNVKIILKNGRNINEALAPPRKIYLGLMSQINAMCTQIDDKLSRMITIEKINR